MIVKVAENYLAFLDEKPLYYDEIDYDRMPRTWASISSKVALPKIIHLVGTNGKGTTGRFLATALQHAGYKTGHYTSPHILRFNERMWIDGTEASDAQLQEAFTTVRSWLSDEQSQSLSYFEFTTLMAVALFQECDYIVMEAGLGGEHDATAVFKKHLTLFTPIGFDHQAFLGTDLDAIAATKLRAMADDAIIGVQPYAKVYEIAEAIAREKGARLRHAESLPDENGIMLLQKTVRRLNLAPYLEQNLMLAMAALVHLEIGFDEWSFGAPLFGRLSKIAPNIWLDVGHNVLAAKAIAETLAGKKMVLIYNSYGDKDYAGILEALRPLIVQVQLISVQSERAASTQVLVDTLDTLQIPWREFEGTDSEHEYLVFGSFSVAEAFLKCNPILGNI